MLGSQKSAPGGAESFRGSGEYGAPDTVSGGTMGYCRTNSCGYKVTIEPPMPQWTEKLYLLRPRMRKALPWWGASPIPY